MDTVASSGPSEETVNLARREVRSLLSRSDAFRALDPDTQREIARNTVAVASYLAEPDGVRAAGAGDPYAFAQADDSVGRVDETGAPEFVAGAAREGVQQAGALLENVNFPTFVAQLIQGVFHSIVESSIQQMEAYGQLVADVAKSLNQFRDENVTVNQGRDQLVDMFPDVFEIDTGSGDGFFGGDGDSLFGDEQRGPRVRMRADVDEQQAMEQVNASSLGTQVSDLSDESIERDLVPAARTQLATSRQQLLATMVLMGINRIIVTDGKIQAKVLYDFRAKDTMRYQRSATSFDYGDRYTTDTQRDWDNQAERGAVSTSGKPGTEDYEYDREGSKYYTKGSYKYARKPVVTLASATQEAGDAALQTRASLAGVVDINFRSETFPLERMADSFQIGQIQTAAQPGTGQPPTQRGAGQAAPAASGAATPPATGSQPPATATPGPATGGG